MRTTIRSLTKSCKSFQINKRWSCKYGHLLPKNVITNPWECLCVDLIGPYTLKGKDNLQIDFMALTMINPAFSWFEIAELSVGKWIRWQTVNDKELLIADEIFGKTSERIAYLVNNTWLCRYQQSVLLRWLVSSWRNYSSNFQGRSDYSIVERDRTSRVPFLHTFYNYQANLHLDWLNVTQVLPLDIVFLSVVISWV